MSIIGTAYAIKSYIVKAGSFVIVDAPIDCDTFSVRPMDGLVNIFTDTDDTGDDIAALVQETVQYRPFLSPRFKQGAHMFGLRCQAGQVVVKVKFLL